MYVGSNTNDSKQFMLLSHKYLRAMWKSVKIQKG